jgi:hypothetical protein
MTVTEIRKMAQALSLKNYSRLRKDSLIWAVQKAEGNSDCFKKIPGCGQLDCCWRGECQG